MTPLDGALVDAVTELEKLSRYAKKQPLLRQKLQGPYSAVALRLEHAVAQGEGLGAGEITIALETLDKLLSPLDQALGLLAAQPSTTPAALALLSMAQHLVLLLFLIEGFDLGEWLEEGYIILTSSAQDALSDFGRQ